MKKLIGYDYTIAFAGNPNVGKSSIFNNLTGMHQHTGNWPGKTVANAYGICKYNNTNFLLVDLPGTYSLMSNSNEEEIARNYICFSNPDICVVVVDATCLERNLNLVIQILEMTPNVILCVNLLDEAKKKSISIDLKLLSKLLGIPVVGTIANKKSTMENLLKTINSSIKNNTQNEFQIPIKYDTKIENYINSIENDIKAILPSDKQFISRWLSLKILDENSSIINDLKTYLNIDLENNSTIQEKINYIKSDLEKDNLSFSYLRDSIVSTVVAKSEEIRKKTCIFADEKYSLKARKIDKILTSKKFGIPIMLAFLSLIFWITITGANYPSSVLSNFFGFLQEKLLIAFEKLSIPKFFTNIFIYRNVSNLNLGSVRYASTYGNIFPFVYAS